MSRSLARRVGILSTRAKAVLGTTQNTSVSTKAGPFNMKATARTATTAPPSRSISTATAARDSPDMQGRPQPNIHYRTQETTTPEANNSTSATQSAPSRAKTPTHYSAPTSKARSSPPSSKARATCTASMEISQP